MVDFLHASTEPKIYIDSISQISYLPHLSSSQAHTKSLHENTEGYYFRTDVNLSVVIYTSRSNRCKLAGDVNGKDTLLLVYLWGSHLKKYSNAFISKRKKNVCPSFGSSFLVYLSHPGVWCSFDD